MERLTQRANGVVVYVGAHNEEAGGQTPFEVSSRGVREIMARLAEYEDTGLTPEEINDLTSVREISPEAEYAINKHADSIIDRLDKLLAQTDGDDRLHELAEADKEGRVVVLPCKVGDTVWIIPDGKKFALECEVEYANIGERYATIVLCTKDRLRETYGVATAAFGKTAFLTREEAEEAVRRAEYITREALEAHLNRRLKALRAENGDYDHYTDGYDEAVCTVEDFPSADVAPVVRCKDCKYYKPDEYECGCDFAGGLPYVKADDYCSYGERRDT